jgi:hypothetical protein
MHTPAIYVRIKEIQRVKQLNCGLFCTCVWFPTILAALKVFGPNNVSECHCYISNTNLEKICHFPELRISQK